MLNAGYIKIFRKITEWEWYQDANVMRVFIHCLLSANHKDKKWQGKIIKRGSFITSYQKLSSDLKLTIRQIRVALGKLKMTNELTHETTPNYSIITINNYDLYQANDTENDKQMTSDMTNECQTNDKRMTTTNKYKNDKNDKENKKDIYIPEQSIDYKSIIDYLNMKCGTKYKHTSQATKRLIQARVNQGFTYDDFKTVIDKKAKEWLNTDMAKYLRPETLFGNKFEGYLNQKEVVKKMDIKDVDVKPINLF